MVNGRVTVVGVTSFGFSGCPTTAPPAFARVTAGKDWILANSDAGSFQCTGGAIGEYFTQSKHFRRMTKNLHTYKNVPENLKNMRIIAYRITSQKKFAECKNTYPP